MDPTIQITLITSVTTILGTLIGIIPTIKSNRKKTEEAITDMKTEMDKSLNTLSDKIETVEKNLAAHTDADDDDKAEQRRVRILRFEDDMDNKSKWPTEGNFEQVMVDINYYRTYADKHPNFHNGIGMSAMDRIERCYEECKENKSFGQLK